MDTPKNYPFSPDIKFCPKHNVNSYMPDVIECPDCQTPGTHPKPAPTPAPKIGRTKKAKAQPKLDEFTRHYIECALWSSTDGDGDPLDSAKYADAELADETRARFVADCTKFQEESAAALAAACDDANYPDAKIAHDFWLTRNRHGAGFWDGDYPETTGELLTKLAHSYGECDLYIGDDGKIYIS